ncbi:acyltransferase [Micromonospora sp. PLK6-60]|uniref:acyltransferase family protein n=1 Tax=Micromonospora sp. PLK6-60 TaxID=2873383 RepID=UPI0027DF51FA|nr:acyltransferase [Micromonospora sp. PLK6-60]
MTAAPTVVGPPAADRPSRLPSLTGLRWIAALLVYGYHVGTMGIVADPALKPVVDKTFALGLSGVEFFFVLSGFVLVWSARTGERRRDFWRRRLAKIYPNHLVTWAAALLIAFCFADPFNLQATVENLLLVQAWDPTPGHFYSVNNVSWSLSCELFFYLSLPFALPLLRRMSPAALWAVVVAVPLLIIALWPAQQLVPEADRWWFTQIFPLVRSLEFWLGVAAAELLRRGRWRGPGLPAAIVLFVLTWLVAAVWIRAELWAGLMAAVYVVVIAAAARADVQGRRTPWRGRRMRWLGEVSFAFYLVHVLVMVTVLRLTGHRGEGLPGWWGPAAALGFLLLNLLLAGLLHRWVETPMMRRLGPPRRPPVPAPAAGTPADQPAPTAGTPPAPTAGTPADRPDAGDRAGSAAALPRPRSGDDRPVTYAGRRDPG